MTPEEIIAIIAGVESLAQTAPSIYAEFASLFSNGTPTAQDFMDLKAKIQSETYKQYVPQTDLTDAQLGS